MVSSSSSYRSLSLLLCKFDHFCKSRDLSDKQIDKESVKYFAFCMAKGWDNCVFPEYLAAFAKGDWCQFDGYC